MQAASTSGPNDSASNFILYWTELDRIHPIKKKVVLKVRKFLAIPTLELDMFSKIIVSG